MQRIQLRITELSCPEPASERMLETLGIITLDDLQKIGPVQAYLELECHLRPKPGHNLLYANDTGEPALAILDER
ncbi:MAG: TfoX/Sxy family DNA transformation protein [Arenicellales bacterium]